MDIFELSGVQFHFTTNLAYSAVLSYLGAYADTLGLLGGGSLFFVAYAVTSLFSRPIAGRILDRFGGNIVMYPTLVLLALCMGTIAIASSTALFIIGGILLGLSFSTVSSVGQALAIHGVVMSRIGLATSTFFVIADLGVGIGPYILGSLVPLYGFPSVYYLAGLIALATLPLYYFIIGRKGMFTKRWMQVVQRKAEHLDKRQNSSL